LIEDGLVHDLGRRWDALSEKEQEDLAARSIPVADLAYAPLYRRPRKIWGIGLNYAEHAGDLDEKAPSEEPASFMRPDTTIIGPGEEIRLPEQSQRVTAEAELAVVIGREAKDISEEEAPSIMAGFTTVLDMTAEDILRKNPRYLTRAKSFDTFFSFGPELVTTDEVDDVGALEVSTVLNGEVLRTNTVANMTFSPWWLVSFHSRIFPLLPWRRDLDRHAGCRGHTGGGRGRVPRKRFQAARQSRRPVAVSGRYLAFGAISAKSNLYLWILSYRGREAAKANTSRAAHRPFVGLPGRPLALNICPPQHVVAVLLPPGSSDGPVRPFLASLCRILRAHF
jgi:2-keto-4-pentenoate hydratase/2-oxohepta-3-ene-1,7-dioic acid hydratase in catechol pathway